jgi:hypothetical protein
MLIKINPEQPNLWVQVYQSKNLLTTISVINNEIYTGEIDIETKQNYLSVNKQLTPVNDVVSLVYPLFGKPYFASFKSELNKNTESYYEISGDKIIEQQQDNKVFLHKE